MTGDDAPGGTSTSNKEKTTEGRSIHIREYVPSPPPPTRRCNKIATRSELGARDRKTALMNSSFLGSSFQHAEGGLIYITGTTTHQGGPETGPPLSPLRTSIAHAIAFFSTMGGSSAAKIGVIRGVNLWTSTAQEERAVMIVLGYT